MGKAEIIKARNTSIITKEDYIESVKLSTDRKKKNRCVILSIIILFLGIYGEVTNTVMLGWLFAAFGVVMIAWELFISYPVIGGKSYKKALEVNGGKEITIKVDVYKDHLEMKNASGKTSLKYKKIKRVGKGNNVVILIFSDELAVTFKKDSFTFGSFEDVEAVIEKARER